MQSTDHINIKACTTVVSQFRGRTSQTFQAGTTYEKFVGTNSIGVTNQKGQVCPVRMNHMYIQKLVNIARIPRWYTDRKIARYDSSCVAPFSNNQSIFETGIQVSLIRKRRYEAINCWLVTSRNTIEERISGLCI